MLKVVLLLLQGVERLIFNVPSASASFHQGFNGLFGQRDISHPAPGMAVTFFVRFNKVQNIDSRRDWTYSVGYRWQNDTSVLYQSSFLNP